MSFSFAITTTTDPRTTAATRRRRSNNDNALLSRGGRSCATLSSPPPTKTTFNDDAILLCRRCVQIVVRRRRSGEGLGRKSFNAASASSSRKKNASYGGGDSGGEERGRQKQMQEDRLAYTKSRNRGENTYDFAPTRRGGGGNANTFNNRNNNNNNRNSSGWFEEDEYETQEQRKGGGRGGGGGGGGRNSNNNNQQPRLFPRELDKFLVAGAFVVGIGAGVIFDTAVDLEPSNVASREILDRRTPSSEVCMANGASAMVFDQRVFLSLNPFNVYVAQPEVKPGCVLRRSNWSVLEREKVVTQDQENDCKRNLNTFAYVGDLKKSPEVSCVYHSEEAENQFMKDPSKAVLGDGVRGSEKGKNIAGGGGGSNNKSFR